MYTRLWILLLLPWTLMVDASLFSPPLSRRLPSSNRRALMTTTSLTAPSSPADACSTMAACNSRILPHSRTLTLAVVGIFVACILMAFVSVYARRFCIRERNLNSMDRIGQHRNETLVKSLPVVKHGVQDEAGKQMMRECAVCLSEFERGEMLRLLPACDHLFHKDCIDMWLFSHTTCPLCRLSLLKLEKGRSTSSYQVLSQSVDRQPMLASHHAGAVAMI